MAKKWKDVRRGFTPEEEKLILEKTKAMSWSLVYGKEMKSSALEQRGWSHAEALEIVFCNDVYRGMRAYIKERKFSRKRLQTLLTDAAPEQLADFWNGDLKLIGTDQLVFWACELGLRISVKLTKPKDRKRSGSA
jgi:predicted XRE-type DNA-binding protein